MPLYLPKGITRVTSNSSCAASGNFPDTLPGEERIIGVALFLADVKSFVVGLVKRRPAAETLDQVGIGQQRAAEGDGIGGAGGDGLLRAGEVVAVLEAQIPLEDGARRGIVEGQPRVSRRPAGTLPMRQNSCRLDKKLNLGATRRRNGTVRRSIQEQGGGEVVAAGERRSGRGINLTIMVVAATPEDERDFGVEGAG